METDGSHITGYKTYALIWGLLLLLTAATITVAQMHFTQYAVLISLVIASVKALLVLAFFMHLRYEGAFLKGVVFLAIIALTAIIGLTFVDVWYR
ncbi:MAG: cytochrome C oxidase subunit IV family protein [Nitrospirae bacterium]|nr:cytochrome C oxidase subunit IV family protein [Nitrospirota bacterium]